MARKEQHGFARQKPSIHVPRLGLSGGSGSGAEDQVAGIARPVEHFTSHV